MVLIQNIILKIIGIRIGTIDKAEGLGTSIIRPSAPAIDAFAKETRERIPAAWLGSTIGRWLSDLITGTALTLWYF